MCGIFGVFHLDGRPAAQAPLRRMALALRHRGPNGEATWTRNAVGLGLVRLAIVGTAQPAQVFGVDRVHAVVNGEVYGHAAVARGHGLPVDAVDTQLLARVAARDGAPGVMRVPGTFAAAWWDGRRLWLARDRVGKKPLFYARVGHSVWFASEMKALLAAGAVDGRPDPGHAARFLCNGMLEEHQPILHGVEVVPPGTALGLDAHGITRVDAPPWKTLDAKADLVPRMQRAWRRAVDVRLPREVGGVTLFSGGLDSTLVAARARLPLFTLRVPESDESTQAQRRARTLKLPITVVEAPPRTRTWMRHALFHLESPDAFTAWGMAPAVMALAAAVARSGARVALGGEGADEIFLGYPWHRAAYAMEHHRTARGLDPVTVQMVHNQLALGRVRGQPVRPLEAWLRTGSIQRHLHQLYAGQAITVDEAPSGHVPVDVPHAARQRQWDALRRDMLALPVLHADRLVLAYGVEMRLPFLDDTLVSLALTLPAAQLEHARGDKPFLRRLARSLFPGLRHPPKRGFTAPRMPDAAEVNAWARQRARAGTRLLDLERIWRQHAPPNAQLEALWRALVLEETLDVLLSAPAPPPATLP